MGVVRRQLLIKALKLFDLLVMTLAFILAAVPVSQGGEASFAEFLSMRIKVENFILSLRDLCREAMRPLESFRQPRSGLCA
jgi:hypothetical protein